MTHDADIEAQREQRRARAQSEVGRAFALPHPPVLVHQMGKVGSTTIMDTLGPTPAGDRLFHVHYLSDQLDAVGDLHVRSGILPEPQHIFDSYALRDALERHPERRVKVISLVRDPVARQISDAFQNPEFADRELRDASGQFDAQRVTAYLNQRFSDPDFLWGPRHWFDVEIKAVWDIDVYDKPFADDGLQIYSSARADLLVYRLEDLDTRRLRALGPFLGFSPFLVREVRGNVREESDDAGVYAKVKSSVRLHRRVLEQVYDHRSCRYFYTPEMIGRMIDRWASD